MSDYRVRGQSRKKKEKYLFGPFLQMEWLAKATDLLDKVDQLAAERLGDEEDAEVADDDVLALLDATEGDEEDEGHAPAGNAAAAALSTHGTLPRCAWRAREEELGGRLRTRFCLRLPRCEPPSASPAARN
jgi:hypothetical protein